MDIVPVPPVHSDRFSTTSSYLTLSSRPSSHFVELIGTGSSTLEETSSQKVPTGPHKIMSLNPESTAVRPFYQNQGKVRHMQQDPEGNLQLYEEDEEDDEDEEMEESQLMDKFRVSVLTELGYPREYIQANHDIRNTVSRQLLFCI